MVLLAFESGGLRINTSSSFPDTLYRLAPGEAALGDLVVVCPPPGAVSDEARRRGYLAFGLRCPGRYAPLIKRIVAIQGDRFAVYSEGVAINGRPLAGSAPLPHDPRGRRLPRRFTKGAVPPDHFWLASPHPRSYDSRYFGPVPATAVRSRVAPVL